MGIFLLALLITANTADPHFPCQSGLVYERACSYRRLQNIVTQSIVATLANSSSSWLLTDRSTGANVRYIEVNLNRPTIGASAHINTLVRWTARESGNGTASGHNLWAVHEGRISRIASTFLIFDQTVVGFADVSAIYFFLDWSNQILIATITTACRMFPS